jgi:hypothetical protein
VSIPDNEFLISSKNVVHILSIIMANYGIYHIDMSVAFCPSTKREVLFFFFLPHIRMCTLEDNMYW